MIKKILKKDVQNSCLGLFEDGQILIVKGMSHQKNQFLMNVLKFSDDTQKKKYST